MSALAALAGVALSAIGSVALLVTGPATEASAPSAPPACSGWYDRDGMCVTDRPRPPAVDDGPCPAGTFGWLPDGAYFEDGVWYRPPRTPFGTAEWEDGCWTPTSPPPTTAVAPPPAPPGGALPATR